MKKLLFFAAIATLVSCTSVNEGGNNEGSNTESKIVENFLSDIESLEDIEGKNPIALFTAEAGGKADKVMNLDKDNVKDVLATAKTYKNTVIVIGDHTIVKLGDIDNCKQSGSWGACMPFAMGYIKKGDLEHQKDYINNIIGLPDSQERTDYFFN